MNPRLATYFSRMLLARFLVLMLTLGSMLMLIEFLNVGDKISGLGDWAVPRFLILRLPDVFANLVPFTVLLAALLTLVALARNSELVAFRAAGISQWRMMLALLPGALAIALIQFVLIDFVAPPANDALRRSGAGDLVFQLGNGDLEEVWVQLEGDFVRYRVDPQSSGERVYDVLIYERDKEGQIVAQVSAPVADIVEGGWRLHEVRRIPADGRPGSREATRLWSGGLDPSVLTKLTLHPRELAIGDLYDLAEEKGLGNRPQYLYELWLTKKLILPLTSILLVLAMVPLVQGFDRARGSFFALVAGIATGLAFISIDGLFVAIGESGLLPPVVAASLATLILLASVGTVAFNRE
jgi:lipopolysaccharide export system permease protein